MDMPTIFGSIDPEIDETVRSVTIIRNILTPAQNIAS